MVTLIKAGRVNDYIGKKADPKPEDAPNGSSFYEMDSGDKYYFDADSSSWVKAS